MPQCPKSTSHFIAKAPWVIQMIKPPCFQTFALECMLNATLPNCPLGGQPIFQHNTSAAEQAAIEVCMMFPYHPR